MKRLIYLQLCMIFIYGTAISQNITSMKEELFHGIKLFVIPGNQIKNYIKDNKGEIDVEFSKLNRIPTYVFPNKNYLYDFNAHAFLFASKDDLIKFKQISNELADRELKIQKINNLDENFIQNIDPLILSFENAYQIKFDFNKLEDVKRLDKLINNEKNKAIFRTKWKDNLIAIIGKFIIRQLHSANWAINKVNGNSSLVIVDAKMNFYNPIMIVDKELNNYLPEEGSVGFFDHTQIELIQYKVFNQLTK